MKTDILIAGSGCSGLYCALQLPRTKQITIITKAETESSDSYLAQGGMCMLKEDLDYEAFFEGDGTTYGGAPFVARDRCLWRNARHHDRRGGHDPRSQYPGGYDS